MLCTALQLTEGHLLSRSRRIQHARLCTKTLGDREKTANMLTLGAQDTCPGKFQCSPYTSADTDEVDVPFCSQEPVMCLCEYFTAAGPCSCATGTLPSSVPSIHKDAAIPGYNMRRGSAGIVGHWRCPIDILIPFGNSSAFRSESSCSPQMNRDTCKRSALELKIC